MLRKGTGQQQGYEIVLLEELVPQDHLLRKIAAAVDFSFIHELCKDLYSPDNGRPAVPPEMLFKMLLLGYLYGIKSETRLSEMVNDSLAFKWFLGLGLREKGPDHATISINRVRRFRDNDIAERIFEEILKQCIERGLVGGQILYTDLTHVKAKANKHRKVLVTVDETPKAYIEELNAQIDLDRQILGKKPFDRDDDPPGGGEAKQQRQKMASRTDPDSGQLNREGKPEGFHYGVSYTTDAKNNVIVDVNVMAGNENDVIAVPTVIQDVVKRLGSRPKFLCFDAGYHTAPMAHLLSKNGIQGVLGYRRHTYKTPYLGKWRFRYDEEFDVFTCPNHERLYWKTTDREGYRHYCSDRNICARCSYRSQCFSESETRKELTRHVWQDSLDDITAFTKTGIGHKLYSWRKETVERAFAEAKENHGLRTARMLGLKNMREQAFLTAAIQNIKRLAKAFGSGLRSFSRLARSLFQPATVLFTHG